MLGVSTLFWPVRALGALLPDGWGGFARQLAIFIPFDIAYELSRGLRDGRRGDGAPARARRRAMRSGRSASSTSWPCSSGRSMRPTSSWTVARFTYFQCQFTITFGFVIWVYVWRNYAYTLLRNTLFATFMLAVPGYILYPTAPPRLLARAGLPRPAGRGDAQSAGHAREALRQPVRGDAEPAHGDGAARRARPACWSRATSSGARSGRSTRRSSSSRSSPRPTISSSTPSPGAIVLAVALSAVLALHRHKGWSIAPLGDRSPAGTDRSSIQRAGPPTELRPSDR